MYFCMYVFYVGTRRQFLGNKIGLRVTICFIIYQNYSELIKIQYTRVVPKLSDVT